MRTPAILLCAVALTACGEDGSSGSKEPCKDAATVHDQAVSAFCADETEYCCYCQCWESTGGSYDVVELQTNASCVCVTPPPSPSECTGDVLDAAEHCLEDEDSCAAVETFVTEALCEDSAL